MTEAIPTVTLIGLIILVASLPTLLVTGAIDVWLNTWPGWSFIAVVMLVVGATLAFAGAL